ncbi:cytoskeletal motor fibril protein Fib [Spiroplasma endosymbiont of Megaselia nigra]|uniref:cytoskeletal motor fibril protein Fib n=1 Tax=Spiroplasma endosymbiont of Megaselia nigra TaxID=2478537 RepID=UPI000F89374A|nr:cytoskeletal motor fibril protein Fib [Spiroplasma endosymbiont of Megaselia nigra]RUO86521.1 cytoskeletal motor fibril protein Fib [Spiroplasma endosymbiont of Megaselia nigra]
MIGVISTAYFTMKDKHSIKTVKKYWWKNCVIQHVKYHGKTFIIATVGYGKANAAMALTYLLEKYPGLQTILNVDLALSTNDKHDTGDTTISTKFIYRDADLTVFKDIKYGQIVNEPESFQFDGEFAKVVKDFKLGLTEGVTGTADMLIYNSKQFKEMVDKYGHTIDVIDTEAGAIAQVAKKSSINYIALKIIYNNALSPWDNDPIHKFKMYETVNTLKYLLRRLFNLLSSNYIIDLSQSSQDDLDSINELFEIKHDQWIKLFKPNTHKVLSGFGPSLMLVDKQEKTPVALDIIQVMRSKTKEAEGSSKVILGEDEWKNAPKKWLRKLLFLEQVRVNDDELLWNKSAKYDLNNEKLYKIETVANEIAAAIAEKCQDKSSYTYNGATVQQKYLLVNCDAKVSFYITHNQSHEFVEDKNFGTQLVSNEFVKYLNEALKDVDSPYQQIVVYMTIPALDYRKIPVFIPSNKRVNRGVKFGTLNKKLQRDYTVVDITRNDYDPIKVGSFKVTIRLKSE